MHSMSSISARRTSIGPGRPARPRPPGRAMRPRRGSRPVSALSRWLGARSASSSEPVDGHGREHPTLLGDGLLHDHVEGRDPVGGHHQQAVVAGVVELAHLARLDERQAGQCGRADAHGASSSRASVNRWTWRRVRDRSKAASRAVGRQGHLGVLVQHLAEGPALGPRRRGRHAGRSGRRRHG